LSKLVVLEDLEEKECDDEEEEEERVKVTQLGQLSLDGSVRVTDGEKNVFHYIIIPQPKIDTDGRQMSDQMEWDDERMSIKVQCFR
jgi:hypothetical protein